MTVKRMLSSLCVLSILCLTACKESQEPHQESDGKQAPPLQGASLQDMSAKLSKDEASFKLPQSVLDQKPIYNIQHFTLENGLQVYLIENHKIPVVSHTIVYKVGSVDDPLGKSGLAHFVEHMMFKGPKDSPPTEIWSFTCNVGGEINAATSYNWTYYYEIVPKKDILKIMQLEADRLQKLDIVPEQVISERKVIVEERFMRFENNPVGLFFESVMAAFYAHHPYRITTIGWLSEMKNLDGEDVRKFHQNWYAPNNAFVILSGDLTLAQAKELTQSTYGKLKAKPIPPRNYVQEPPRRIHQQVTMYSKEIASPYVFYLFAAPNYQKEAPRTAYALSLGVFGLTNAATGILYKRLVEDLKVAASFSMQYDMSQLDRGQVQIFAQAVPGISEEQLREVIERELKSFLAKGFTQEQLQIFKTQRVAGLDFIKDSLQAGAGDIIGPLISGMPLDELEHWTYLIEDVTLEEVQKGLEQVFNTRNYLVARLLPEEKEVALSQEQLVQPNNSNPVPDLKETH